MSGWGTIAWGTGPWGSVDPILSVDINWSFEDPDTEDPPGAESWTWTALDAGFWTALFGTGDEYESWTIAGYKFTMGSLARVADFTTQDGSVTWAESFESRWLGNSSYNFTTPGDSPVLLFGSLSSEDFEGWLAADLMVWKSFRMSLGLSVQSAKIDDTVLVGDRVDLVMVRATVDTERAEWESQTLSLEAGEYTAAEFAVVLTDWFATLSFFTGMTAVVINDRVVVTFPLTADTVFQFSKPNDIDRYDGWQVFGFPIGAYSRINGWDDSEVGTFGNWEDPVGWTGNYDTFDEAWGASAELWFDLPGGYTWQWENGDYQAIFGVGHECGESGFAETFNEDCWPDAPDPITTV